MLITPIEIRKKANQKERARIDDARNKAALSYMDSLDIASKVLGRYILGYNDICSSEVSIVIQEFRKERQFEWKGGRRKVVE